MYIDQSEMYYVLMDLTQQAVQTNKTLFSNFGIIFRINYNFFKIMVALGFYKRRGGGAEQTARVLVMNIPVK